MSLSESVQRAAKEVDAASKRISGLVAQTPCVRSIAMSAECGADVYFKLEFVHPSGSFKLRGAANKMLSLTAEERERGVIAASTGNHALAVAHVADALKCHATLVMPTTTSSAKQHALKRFEHVTVVLEGEDCLQSEEKAREISERCRLSYVSPYNDLLVMGGQGTAAVEVEAQLADRPADVYIVSVGGGGLIGGMAAYIKSKRPQAQVWGAQPVNSKVMYESVLAGKILDLPSDPTVSDGTAGGIEENSVTFDVVRDCVDKWVLCSEDEIQSALIWLLREEHFIIEGAAALAAAAAFRERAFLRGLRVAIVLCGRMLSLPDLQLLLPK